MMKAGVRRGGGHGHDLPSRRGRQPTHNDSLGAIMKAFIDRLYAYYDFTNDRPRRYSSRLAGQGRKAAVCAVCEQVDKKDMGYTLEMLRLPLEPLGWEITDQLPVYGVFDRGKVRGLSQVLKQAGDLGRNLARRLLAP